MQPRALGTTGLSIAPIVFGGNVLGWNVDEKTTFDVLDAFVDQGFNAIDTADVYSAWAPGNRGGESETLIGRWLKRAPSRRDQLVIFTKVGSDLGQPGQKGLSQRWIREAVEHSLRRLGVDTIDLYFSHFPDADTPHEETLTAYARLLEAGKIRAIGASNFSAEQLRAALRIAQTQALPSYQVVQPEYNLYDRAGFDGALRELCLHAGLGVVTYYSLASGFLSGKYRSPDDLGQSVRGKKVGQYLNPRGHAILHALDEVAARHQAAPADIALAWLLARDGVTAPIASATRVEQLASFARAVTLSLSTADLAQLDAASAYSH